MSNAVSQPIVGTALSLHSLAILWTLFRLWYRWSMALIWWDDAWAVVALLADAASLISLVLEQFISGTSSTDGGFTTTGQWIGTFAFSTITWATRISILTFMIRVSQPEVALKRIALCIGLAFGVMWMETIAQRLETCTFRSCGITTAIVTTQIVMDCIADILLTALPIIFLHGMKLSRDRKMLQFATFSANMVVSVVTVIQATVLSELGTSESIMVAHIKTALSLIVCDLLVIVAIISRTVYKRQPGLVESGAVGNYMACATVDLGQETSSLLSSATGPHKLPEVF